MECGSGVGQPTISLFMLLVFSHRFDTCSPGKEFVGEAALVVRLVRLRTILSVDIIAGF